MSSPLGSMWLVTVDSGDVTEGLTIPPPPPPLATKSDREEQEEEEDVLVVGKAASLSLPLSSAIKRLKN